MQVGASLLLLRLRQLVQDVRHHVHPAPLPARIGKHLA
jgi:hypothetical protein